jgi:hypothetical protein
VNSGLQKQKPLRLEVLVQIQQFGGREVPSRGVRSHSTATLFYRHKRVVHATNNFENSDDRFSDRLLLRCQEQIRHHSLLTRQEIDSPKPVLSFGEADENLGTTHPSKRERIRTRKFRHCTTNKFTQADKASDKAKRRVQRRGSQRE